MPPAGTTFADVARGGAPALSPDGQMVALSNLNSTYLMRADGSGLNRLLTRGDPGGLDWRA